MALSTPINTLSRKDLIILIRNNTLDDSLEFATDCEVMDTESPRSAHRQPLRALEPVTKKLFHSPKFQNNRNKDTLAQNHFGQDKNRRPQKRKQFLLPGNDETIKKAYVKEYERDGSSDSPCEGMRKKVLISLFHNREYSMDFSE